MKEIGDQSIVKEVESTQVALSAEALQFTPNLVPSSTRANENQTVAIEEINPNLKLSDDRLNKNIAESLKQDIYGKPVLNDSFVIARGKNCNRGEGEEACAGRIQSNERKRSDAFGKHNFAQPLEGANQALERVKNFPNQVRQGAERTGREIQRQGERVKNGATGVYKEFGPGGQGYEKQRQRQQRNQDGGGRRNRRSDASSEDNQIADVSVNSIQEDFDA